MTSDRRMAETADNCDLFDVIILGAGLTGLSLARQLAQHVKRPSFIVLEAGGNILLKIDGYLRYFLQKFNSYFLSTINPFH